MFLDFWILNISNMFSTQTNCMKDNCDMDKCSFSSQPILRRFSHMLKCLPQGVSNRCIHFGFVYLSLSLVSTKNSLDIFQQDNPCWYVNSITDTFYKNIYQKVSTAQNGGKGLFLGGWGLPLKGEWPILTRFETILLLN